MLSKYGIYGWNIENRENGFQPFLKILDTIDLHSMVQVEIFQDMYWKTEIRHIIWYIYPIYSYGYGK